MKRVLSANSGQASSAFVLNKKQKVKSAQEAFHLFRESWDPNLIHRIEQFKVMMLNERNEVLGLELMSSGNATSTEVDLREVFNTALNAHSSKIMVCHNHPSGRLRPSWEDIRCTSKLVLGGKIFCLEILDHLIISRVDYLSMKEKGFL